MVGYVIAATAMYVLAAASFMRLLRRRGACRCWAVAGVCRRPLGARALGRASSDGAKDQLNAFRFVPQRPVA